MSRTILAMGLILLLAACRRPAAPLPPSQLVPEHFSGDVALREAEDFLRVGPRVAGTAGANAAADYLYRRLADKGLDPSIDVFSEQTAAGQKTFRNVTAVVPGTGTGIVVLASHYDTKSGIADDFVGANDSGSSTAVLLTIADLLTNRPPLRPTVVLAFLDGEECVRSYAANDGLHGSRRLLHRMTGRGELRHIKAFILLDMVGDRHLSVTLPANTTPELAALTFAAARAEGVRLRFCRWDRDILDDHVPFLEAGVPAIDLIDFDYGSAPGRNDYWHTAKDTVDKLSPESLQIIGRVTIRMLNAL